MSQDLTHLNQQGEAHMVDVGDKADSKRSATARAYIDMKAETLAMITDGRHKKGDVFAVARIAGIQSAKRCADLIPLCHPLMLTKIAVDIRADNNVPRVQIDATCELRGKTGVEMEALTAVSIAALTIYDMCKAVDRGMCISSTRLITKTGGKSGDWHHE